MRTLLAPVAIAIILHATPIAPAELAARLDDDVSIIATPRPIDERVATITPAMIQADVDFLASDGMYGRFYRSPFGIQTAKWLAAELAEVGVEPFGDLAVAADHADREKNATGETRDATAPVDPARTWFQPITEDEAVAPNVVGILRAPARDGVTERFVLISAHFDHLPPPRPRPTDAPDRDRIYNGADDNASGCAGVLAVARALAPLRESLTASVVFIGFTGEEAGLKGSRFLAANPPMPLERVIGLFNMDMISRGEANTIFIDGAKQAPTLIAALRAANAHEGLTLRVDEHPEWLQRSDQGPFLQRGVEAVLFSVEDHEDYHQVTDHADRIIAPLAARVARLVTRAVFDLATGN